MPDLLTYSGSNFATAPCPECGGLFSRCGLPNHIRRHKIDASKSHKPKNPRSLAWWNAWKDGYRAGLEEGRKRRRQKSSPHAEPRA